MGDIDYVIAVVEFESDLQTKEFYDYMNGPKKRGLFTNHKNEEIKINYCFDATMIDSEQWAAVILRNLPPTVMADTIKKNCSLGGKVDILYILTPRPIRGVTCCIVRVSNIEDAEKICKEMNYKKISAE